MSEQSKTARQTGGSADAPLNVYACAPVSADSDVTSVVTKPSRVRDVTNALMSTSSPELSDAASSGHGGRPLVPTTAVGHELCSICGFSSSLTVSVKLHAAAVMKSSNACNLRAHRQSGVNAAAQKQTY